jgi:hypothetical protein
VKTCRVVVTKVHFKALNYINFIKIKITNSVNIFVLTFSLSYFTPGRVFSVVEKQQLNKHVT